MLGLIWEEGRGGLLDQRHSCVKVNHNSIQSEYRITAGIVTWPNLVLLPVKWNVDKSDVCSIP